NHEVNTCGRLRSATTTDRASHNTSDRVYQNWGDREAGISDREMPNTQPVSMWLVPMVVVPVFVRVDNIGPLTVQAQRIPA
ncbi:MAG: hypothetical protein GY808_11370, partial [Gammaproteobacteria bacterium]|nr:hypothetical protein [Gammaproteobacteria bacterium]